jgi:hypothetical protein
MTAALFAIPFNRPVNQPLRLAIGAGIPILAPNGVSS